MGAGLVLRGELHRGRNGAAGELDYALAGLPEEVDPCAPRSPALAARLAPSSAADVAPRRRSTRARSSPPRAAGDPLAPAVVDEEARRIALHVVPIAAVADVALVVLGGGIGANGDLLLDPIRGLLAEWLPLPAARRGVEPRRGGGPHRRARGRPPLGADNVFANRRATA